MRREWRRESMWRAPAESSVIRACMEGRQEETEYIEELFSYPEYYHYSTKKRKRKNTSDAPRFKETLIQQIFARGTPGSGSRAGCRRYL